MVIRNTCWHTDREQLSNFDASFSTEFVYRVVLNGISAEILEEKLDAPLQKIFPLDVESDISGANFSVVAEINRVIVGFATAKYENWNKRVVLTGVYVLPNSKSKGIGKALMDAVLDYAKTTPARCLWLETQNVNSPAIAFYTKLGFQFCGFDTTLYDDTETSLNEVAFYFCRFI
ncbi:MAG TPA: GNAT family N-acetyltransferase [Abditibacteriaceae bacterium]|jgi:ribosomal protein S18 acetylase RimI-like enzyme